MLYYIVYAELKYMLEVYAVALEVFYAAANAAVTTEQ
jgi:hypothetical protein